VRKPFTPLQTKAVKPLQPNRDARRRLTRTIPRWAPALAAILVLAAGGRLAFCLQARHIPYFTEPGRGTDQEMYLTLARTIVAGGGFGNRVDANPLYPLAVLPLILVLAGKDTFAALLVQGALAGLASTWLMYALARRLAGRTVGLVAAVLVAVYPPFIVYDCAFLSEPVINVACLGALLGIARLRDRQDPGALLLSGVLLGLAVLAKPALLILAPLVPVMLVVHRRGGTRQAAWRTALVAGAAASVIAPVTIRNYRATGEFIPVRTNSAQLLLMGNHPGASGHFGYLDPESEWGRREREAVESAKGSPSAADAARRRLAFDFMRAEPGEFLRLTLRKLGLFFASYEFGNNLSVMLYRQKTHLGLPVLPTFGWILAAALLAPVVARGGGRDTWLVYAFVALSALSTALFVVVSRYVLPATLGLIVLAALAAVRVAGWWRERRRRRAAVTTAAVLLLAAFLYQDQLYRWLTPVFQPNGFVSPLPDGGVVISDDEGPLRPRFTRLLTPQMVAEKTLVAPGQPAARQVWVEFGFETGPRGECVVDLNECQQVVALAPNTRGQTRIPFPGEALRAGLNKVRIRPLAGSAVGVLVCDRFRFGRSRWRDNDGRWHARHLDEVSWLRFAGEHLLGGEYVIRLVVLPGASP
jgi:hypothetical protein